MKCLRDIEQFLNKQEREFNCFVNVLTNKFEVTLTKHGDLGFKVKGTSKTLEQAIENASTEWRIKENELNSKPKFVFNPNKVGHNLTKCPNCFDYFEGTKPYSNGAHQMTCVNGHQYLSSYTNLTKICFVTPSLGQIDEFQYEININGFVYLKNIGSASGTSKQLQSAFAKALSNAFGSTIPVLKNNPPQIAHNAVANSMCPTCNGYWGKVKTTTINNLPPLPTISILQSCSSGSIGCPDYMSIVNPGDIIRLYDSRPGCGYCDWKIDIDAHGQPSFTLQPYSNTLSSSPFNAVTYIPRLFTVICPGCASLADGLGYVSSSNIVNASCSSCVTSWDITNVQNGDVFEVKSLNNGKIKRYQLDSSSTTNFTLVP